MISRARGLAKRIRAALDLRRRMRNSRFVIYISLQVILILTGALIASTGELGTAVGTSMIAAGVGGMIVFGWVVFDDAEDQRRKVIADFGFHTAFPYRSIQIKDEYVRRINSARSAIDVMGYGLNALREDFVGEFEGWTARAKVRILLIDPGDSEGNSYADQRDLEEGSPRGKIRQEVDQFIADTASIVDSSKGRFEVRLAKTIPSVNMFRIDDEVFWGPYLVSPVGHGRTSRNLPTLIVGRPGYMFDRLVDHFEEIWSNPALSRAPEQISGR